MDKQKRQVLQAIAKRAHEVTPPGSTILLFGSRARGDERPDSDWDILVLLDKEKITADDHDLFTKKDWQDNRTAIFRHNVLEDAIPL